MKGLNDKTQCVPLFQTNQSHFFAVIITCTQTSSNLRNSDIQTSQSLAHYHSVVNTGN